jgi:nucleoside-diphosphate-sugar epimerase
MLLTAGWHVEVVVRPTSSTESLKSWLDLVRVHTHDGSAKSMRAIVAASGADVVFHLAAMTPAEHKTSDLDALVGTNVLFATQLVDAMHREGVRLFVNAETFWQYRHGTEIYSAVCLYAATKQAFRDILAWYCDAHGIDAISLVIYDTYGSNDPRPKLLRLLQQALWADDAIDLTRGEQEVVLLHADDVARAFLRAAEILLAGQNSGLTTYGLHDQHRRTLRQLIELIEHSLQRKFKINWGGRNYRDREVMTPWMCPVLPGWSPQVDIVTGVTNLFDAATGQPR